MTDKIDAAVERIAWASEYDRPEVTRTELLAAEQRGAAAARAEPSAHAKLAAQLRWHIEQPAQFPDRVIPIDLLRDCLAALRADPATTRLRDAAQRAWQLSEECSHALADDAAAPGHEHLPVDIVEILESVRDFLRELAGDKQ